MTYHTVAFLSSTCVPGMSTMFYRRLDIRPYTEIFPCRLTMVRTVSCL